MTPFITKEEIAAARAKSSRRILIEELGKEIVLVKPSAKKSLEIGELQEKMKAGKASRLDLMIFTMQAMCATVDGVMFDAQTASMVLDAIGIEALTKLLTGLDEKKSDEKSGEGNG